MSHNWYPRLRVIDLREYLHRILYGDEDNPGVGRPVLIRRLFDKHCECWDGLAGTPKSNCVYCRGEGYLFTETLHTAYLAKNFSGSMSGAIPIQGQSPLQASGWLDNSRMIAYFEYDVFPDYERYLIPTKKANDKLFELKADEDGSLFYPVTRVAKWKITAIVPHQGDDGRIEYFEVGCEKESV